MKERSWYRKFANLAFEPVTNLIVKIYPGLVKRLSKNITYAGMEILTLSYLNVMALTAFLVFSIGIAVSVVALYQYSIWYPFIIALVLGGLVKIVFLAYPKCKARKRGKKLDKELPFFVSLLSSFANLGLVGDDLFKPLLNQKYLKSDAIRVVNFIRFKRKSFRDSLIDVSKLTPSKKMSLFFQELAGFKYKTEIVKYLKSRANSLIKEYEKKRSVFVSLFKESGNIFHMLKFRWIYLLFIVISLVLITGLFFWLFDFARFDAPLHFYVLILVAILIGWMPVFIDMNKRFKLARVQENHFFNFIKDLENHKLNVLSKNSYGILTSNVQKLINQYKMGIPLNRVFLTFSNEIKNETITEIIDISIEVDKINKDMLNNVQEITKVFIMRNKLKFQR